MTTKDATFQLAKKIRSGTTQLSGEWKELSRYIHLTDRTVQVHFDSKEKFDRAGGWRGYYH